MHLNLGRGHSQQELVAQEPTPSSAVTQGLFLSLAASFPAGYPQQYLWKSYTFPPQLLFPVESVESAPPAPSPFPGISN